MRIGTIACVLSMLAACATTQTPAPREYLDEQTAATITVVAQPWIFVRERSTRSAEDRDFLNLYAIDVNRMGDHRQYLAVLQALSPASSDDEPAPTLELLTGGDTLSLQATRESERQLGIAQPLAPSYSLTSKWWYFPIDKRLLGQVARAQDVQAALVRGGQRSLYVMWRDGRAELAELTAVLP